MTDYVQRWIRHAQRARVGAITKCISVHGVCSMMGGAGWMRASGHIVVSPSTSFEIVGDSDLETLHEASRYFEFFVFGLLDVILLGNTLTLETMKITVTELKVDERDSSGYAFRYAGRDAAERFLEEAIKQRAVTYR